VETEEIQLLHKSRCLLAKEYENLIKKFEKKREKELEKLKAKYNCAEELTEDDLADLYGYENITEKEYHRRLKQLHEAEDNKLKIEDTETPISKCLKALRANLYNVRCEIDGCENDLAKRG
jgi:hypothetical protein